MRDAESQIDEIMDNFDFARCVQAMAFLDWKWRGETVTEPMMRESARRYLREIAVREGVSMGSGGLIATNDDGYLSLMFELAGWACE